MPLSKIASFTFLVCASHKKPVELYNFNRLYLKKYFEFKQRVKSSLDFNVKIRLKTSVLPLCP